MPEVRGIRSYQLINEGTDEQLVFLFFSIPISNDSCFLFFNQQILYGYSRSIARTIITWIFIVLTAGFLRLVFYWKPHWFLRCYCYRADLSVAQYVLLKVKQLNSTCNEY